jgi:hypothetical protein
MPTIYVLLCAKSKYYVGKTDRPLEARIEEHFTNNGCEWTKKYKPQKVIETYLNADDFDEDKYTKIYMRRYGINNVRGGSYAEVNLPAISWAILEKELCSVSNLCFKCNRAGHFAANCKSKHNKWLSDVNVLSAATASSSTATKKKITKPAKPVKPTGEIWCCDFCDKEFDSEAKAEAHEILCRSKQRSETPGFFSAVFSLIDVPTDEPVKRKAKPKIAKH